MQKDAVPELDSTEPKAPESDRPSAPAPNSRRKRIASFVFAVGAAVVLLTILPDLPMDREVRIRVERPETVRQVSLVWFDEQKEPMKGAHFRFPDGAPRIHAFQLPLAKGRYEVELQVERLSATDTFRQTVDVDGDEPIELTAR